MREFIAVSLLNSFSLYLASAVFPGIKLTGELVGLLWAGLVLSLVNKFAKPLLKLILLPLSLLTLGLINWVNKILILFIADQFLTEITVIPTQISAWHWAGFSTPAVLLNQGLSYLVAALLFSLIYQLLDKILCPDY